VQGTASGDGGRTRQRPAAVVAPGAADPASGVTAAALPGGDQLEIFWARGGSVFAMQMTRGTPQSQRIVSRGVRANCPLAAVALVDRVHVFRIGDDDTIRTEGTRGPLVGRDPSGPLPRSGLVAFEDMGQAAVLWLTVHGSVDGSFGAAPHATPVRIDGGKTVEVSPSPSSSP
jgi:hypothetical protein